MLYFGNFPKGGRISKKCFILDLLQYYYYYYYYYLPIAWTFMSCRKDRGKNSLWSVDSDLSVQRTAEED